MTLSFPPKIVLEESYIVQHTQICRRQDREPLHPLQQFFWKKVNVISQFYHHSMCVYAFKSKVCNINELELSLQTDHKNSCVSRHTHFCCHGDQTLTLFYPNIVQPPFIHSTKFENNPSKYEDAMPVNVSVYKFWVCLPGSPRPLKLLLEWPWLI